MTSSISKDFEEYLSLLETEVLIRQEIRLRVHDLDQLSRGITAILEKIHQFNEVDGIPSICSQIKSIFRDKVSLKYKELSEVIPDDQYYRYSNMWQVTTQRLVHAAALTHYLLTEKLMKKDEASETLGILPENTGPRFVLDLEDYFGGLIYMSNELSRFAITSVTRKDYKRPLVIASFLNDLNAGFRLLNLKNDSLRKKFDSLKYDIKKVEEVVYDLSIRNFYPDESEK